MCSLGSCQGNRNSVFSYPPPREGSHVSAMREIYKAMRGAGLSTVLACAVFAAGAAEVDWKTNEGQDKWYSLKISGVNAGIMHTVVETSPSGDIRTQETMKMQIDRGQDHVKLKFRTDFIESADGDAIDVGYSQQMAQVIEFSSTNKH